MYCFICGEDCQVVADKKNPSCFKKNPGVLCKTADRGRDQLGRKRKSFKEVLAEVNEGGIKTVWLNIPNNHDKN